MNPSNHKSKNSTSEAAVNYRLRSMQWSEMFVNDNREGVVQLCDSAAVQFSSKISPFGSERGSCLKEVKVRSI